MKNKIFIQTICLIQIILLLLAAVKSQAQTLVFDSTFGTNGKATFKFSATDGINAIALQADGKIIAVGDTGLSQ